MKRLFSGLTLAAALAGVLTTPGTPVTTGALAVSPVAFANSAQAPAARYTAAADMAKPKGECSFGSVCGTVYNGTNLVVKVTMNWCLAKNGPCGPTDIKELKPKKSTHGWGDVDGYLVPDGYKFKVDYQRGPLHETKSFGPGWHKITDEIVADIQSYTH
ncbi:MAG: hypothetical protein JO115_13480 [Pseudonocardiales bacterium]|nr:hypothetical protein [Pseudonocardiales bacterium]